MTDKFRRNLMISVTVVTVAVIIALAVVFMLLDRDDAQTPVFDDSAHIAELEGKDQVIDELSSIKADLEEQLTALEADKASLEGRIAELEGKLTDAGAAFAEEIDGLRADVAEKDAQILKLREDIGKFDNAFNVDVLEQARMIDELCLYIENECPFLKVIFEDGTHEWKIIDELIEEERTKLTEEEAPLFTEEELAESELEEWELTELKLRERVMAREDIEKVKIGVYYEDLLTGYNYGYNADEKFPYASVIKAPYVVSVLREVSADEKAFFDALKESGEEPEMIDTDEDGEPDTVKIEYSDPKYDLSEVVVYDSETMLKSGSGVIRDMPDGTEFTYLDFMKYAITDSDNVAYAQLRARFGYDSMYAFARQAGVSISGSTLSAKGAATLFASIWDFIEEDETYGPVVYDSLRRSNHRVVIPLALASKTVLNKYGWDENSYHDAAIVMAGDRPYVLAVFTDLDFGGDGVNTYLREIVKKIDALHSGFIGK